LAHAGHVLPVLPRRSSAASIHRPGRTCRTEMTGGFMTRAFVRVVMSGAFVFLTATFVQAQAGTSTQTKKFQVISVDGNKLVVRLPEGTRELTVPDDFRFDIDGKMMSVRELQPGMAGTA